MERLLKVERISEDEERKLQKGEERRGKEKGGGKLQIEDEMLQRVEGRKEERGRVKREMRLLKRGRRNEEADI